MTLQDWLNNNGLGQYLAVLLDEEIDMDIVMTLDDADLRALGLKMGARKRFVLAAQRLEQPALPKPPAARSPASTDTPTPGSHSGHPQDEHSNTGLPNRRIHRRGINSQTRHNPSTLQAPSGATSA